jgi:hypothetical protein
MSLYCLLLFCTTLHFSTCFLLDSLGCFHFGVLIMSKYAPKFSCKSFFGGICFDEVWACWVIRQVLGFPSRPSLLLPFLMSLLFLGFNAYLIHLSIYHVFMHQSPVRVLIYLLSIIYLSYFKWTLFFTEVLGLKKN